MPFKSALSSNQLITEGIFSLLKMNKAGANGKSDEALLFLPGFPGIKSQRNEDIAERLSLSLNIDVYVLQYRGLGHNLTGDFSFQQSAREVDECIHWLLNNYSEVSLVAHSWGGALALRFLERVQLTGQALLISPLLKLPNEEEIRSIIDSIYQQYPDLFRSDKSLLANDLIQFGNDFDIHRILKSISFSQTEITIVQAKNDEETPTSIVLSLLPEFGSVRYIELDQDHSFLKSRDELFDTIYGILKDHN